MPRNSYKEQDFYKAMIIWPALVLAAMHRQTLTYKILSELTGIPHRHLSYPLGVIKHYCLTRTPPLPPLTILVVKQNTGAPSTGISEIADSNKAREKVFKHVWKFPKLEELRKTVDKLMK